MICVRPGVEREAEIEQQPRAVVAQLYAGAANLPRAAMHTGGEAMASGGMGGCGIVQDVLRRGLWAGLGRQGRQRLKLTCSWAGQATRRYRRRSISEPGSPQTSQAVLDRSSAQRMTCSTTGKLLELAFSK